MMNDVGSLAGEDTIQSQNVFRPYDKINFFLSSPNGRLFSWIVINLRKTGLLQALVCKVKDELG